MKRFYKQVSAEPCEGGWRVLLDGRLLSTSPVPVDHVTCPAFGGKDLDVLCVTTARMDVSDDRLAAQPETGGLFTVDAHGARGLVEREFED